ncbi:MAG: mechanosensitive ion channel family protein [Deltaproteobacteria bacterium]|nr:mechanosensitive ion channel family protein [Deltaproteobacteria bacterium]
MTHVHAKITWVFLLFFLISFWNIGYSFGSENARPSPDARELKTAPYNPIEMVRHPLAGLNTESPRETLRTFMATMNQAYVASLNTGARSKKTMAFVERASQCLDLSEVPPTLEKSVRLESAYLLTDILNRIELPPLNDIPDKKSMKTRGLSRWTIPHSEIAIARVSEGLHKGQFLFTPKTVSQLEDFYKRVEHLPYKPSVWEKPYASYIFAPGPLIPHQWIERLPQWSKKPCLGQTLWQWIGLALSLLFAALVVWLFYGWEFRRRASEPKDASPWRFGKLFFPASGMALAWGVEIFIDIQLNITGLPLLITKVSLQLCFLIFAGVAIILFGNILVNGITSSHRLQTRSIDNNLVRLSLRVFTLAMLFVLLWYAAAYFGFSVTAVFASAGIAGLAIAMAARETLANFFGGISILLDRPFTSGDYIILDSGERGEVVDIGLRSTRILTRDEILICIPNSVITNVKVVNESAPAPRFRIRIKIGVAYGTDVEQVEEILMKLAQENELAANNPAPRVRFRAFGDSSLDFELLCWARRPEEKGRLIHSLNKGIYNALNEADIAIPFPQRDVHLFKPSEDVENQEGKPKPNS